MYLICELLWLSVSANWCFAAGVCFLQKGGHGIVKVRLNCAPAQERFYFGDTVLPLFQTGIPLLRKRLAELPDNDNITIAYPDEGAWKRFHYQFGDYPEVGTLNLGTSFLNRCTDKVCPKTMCPERHKHSGFMRRRWTTYPILVLVGEKHP